VQPPSDIRCSRLLKMTPGPSTQRGTLYGPRLIARLRL